MKRRLVGAALLLTASGVLTTQVWPQSRGAARSVTVNPDGSVSIGSALVPLPSLMSEGSKKVLMRTKPTEGLGAPVPVPADISDMAELRVLGTC